MTLTELALRRAGAENMQEFQKREGLYPSGREDILTMQRLTPYLLGYERYMVKPGDTYYRLARAFGTTVRSILTANPNQNPNTLLVGQYLNIPYGFPVVPTDIPFTSELLQVCIQGLMVRYPFLSRRTIATTVRITGASLPLCSVRLNRAIPKKDIFRVMEEIDKVQLTAPVRIGQIAIENVCGLGADVIVTKNMDLVG